MPKTRSKSEESGARTTTARKRGRPAVEASIEEAASANPEVATDAEGLPEVGSSLRRVRAARAMSLETLARASGVSRAMLSQIELGRSTPTIKVLWRIARALDLPFSALLSSEKRSDGASVLRADKARRLTSHDGRFSSRALFAPDRPRRVEFYELRLAPRSVEEAVPHPAGTWENLVVNRGAVEIHVEGAVHELGAGDAIQFQADVPHSYRNNGGAETLMYLVMSYADTVAASSSWNP